VARSAMGTEHELLLAKAPVRYGDSGFSILSKGQAGRPIGANLSINKK
jgi:hypothetical protein